MEWLLARLERRLGKLAVPNLTGFVIGGMAIVYVLSRFQPNYLTKLTLDLDAVARGEVWRLVTYLFIPRGSDFFILFTLYWLWFIGSTLESEWGAFKLNAYYLCGMVGTTVAAYLTGYGMGNEYLNYSLIFAVATLVPDYEILLFFILPLRMKWIGLLTGGYVVLAFVQQVHWAGRAAIIAAVANYFIFFGGHLLGLSRQRRLQVRQASRLNAFQAEASEAPTGGRSCAICGAREDDDADIRVCSCEKCGSKPRNLCLAHAKNH
ncbi:rhomboid family intramembrane serine protease [Pendulispora rubella]|uniref:Rhomboid family intramembrane serine protease n=1 Tax=Pendulispora rubella TaxID=2741070 RepID=A0ABZ2LEN0_9BACT